MHTFLSVNMKFKFKADLLIILITYFTLQEVKLRGEKHKLFQSNVEITKIIWQFKNGNLKRLLMPGMGGRPFAW